MTIHDSIDLNRDRRLAEAPKASPEGAGRTSLPRNRHRHLTRDRTGEEITLYEVEPITI
jgi:hypothetical protein